MNLQGERILLVYSAMTLIALLRPYGDVYRLPFPPPAWFLAFVASHFVTTTVYVGARYHQPLDPLLIFFGLLGFVLLLQRWSRLQAIGLRACAA